MTKSRTSLLTDAEEARIQTEIAADPDSQELTDEQIAAGGSAREMLPAGLFAALTRRGRPKSEAAKVLVTLRLVPAVIVGCRRGGPGWQVSMGEVLAAGLKARQPDIETVSRSEAPSPVKANLRSRLSERGTPLRKPYPKSKKPA